MPENNEYGFNFNFNFDDDDLNDSESPKEDKEKSISKNSFDDTRFDDFDIVSSSKHSEDLYEDISSSTEAPEGNIHFETFEDISSNKYVPRKKKGIAAVFQKTDEWWHQRKTSEKSLLIVSAVLFVAAALALIWTVVPLEMRGRLFGSAFGLLIVNLLGYFCVVWKKRKLQTAIMSAVSVLMSGVMILTLFFWIPFLNRIYNFDHTFPDNAEDLGAVPPIDKNITNIALFGIDTRNTESFEGLSDSIMILSINAKEHTVKIISVMRDSLVPINKKGRKKYYGKINGAYAPPNGGPEVAVKTLNEIFNLDITEYATVNFFGMSKIIDAVGGIEVELTEREVKARGRSNHGINDMIGEICQITKLNPNKYYVKKSGKQVLNGIQAVAYSRIRYVPNIWGTNNDFGRTDRQRFVMEQLFNKALTLKKSSYPALVKALIPFTVTSLSPDEILTYAYNILSKSPTFHQERIPHNEYIMNSPSGNFGSVVYYDLEFAAKLIHAFIYENQTFDQYTEINGISKNDWYGNRFGSNSSRHEKPVISRPSHNNDKDNSSSIIIDIPSDNSQDSSSEDINSDNTSGEVSSGSESSSPESSRPSESSQAGSSDSSSKTESGSASSGGQESSAPASSSGGSSSVSSSVSSSTESTASKDTGSGNTSGSTPAPNTSSDKKTAA